MLHVVEDNRCSQTGVCLFVPLCLTGCSAVEVQFCSGPDWDQNGTKCTLANWSMEIERERNRIII